jgi:hypothetical protein
MEKGFHIILAHRQPCCKSRNELFMAGAVLIVKPGAEIRSHIGVKNVTKRYRLDRA